MDISIVKTRLAAAASTVAADPGAGKLNCYGYVPNDVDPPVFYAGEATFQHNITFGDVDQVEITCRVLTSTADAIGDVGQALLDKYLRRKGVFSIRAALLAARGAPGEMALDGACSDFNIQRIQGYRLYRVADKTYFGAELIVMAIGDGESD